MTADADLLEGYDEELGGTEAQRRDCKGITTAIIVVVVIMGMIFAALVVFTPLFAAAQIGTKRLNMSDLRALRYPYAEFAFHENNVIMQSWEGVEMVEHGVPRLIFGRENGAEITPSADLKYFALMEHAANPGMNPQNATFHLRIVNNNERLHSLLPYEFEDLFRELSDSRITHHIGLRNEDSVVQAFKWNGKFNDFVMVAPSPFRWAIVECAKRGMASSEIVQKLGVGKSVMNQTLGLEDRSDSFMEQFRR